MIGARDDSKVKLVFEDGDKNKKLEMVIIRTEEWERQQYIIWFEQKDGEICVRQTIPIGEYISTDDPYFVPRCLFNPAITQARAIFADYGRRPRHHRKKTKTPKEQARLL